MAFLYTFCWYLRVEQGIAFIMEEHKITKKDKIVYGVTLATIFFGLLILGLVGVIINIFG